MDEPPARRYGLLQPPDADAPPPAPPGETDTDREFAAAYDQHQARLIRFLMWQGATVGEAADAVQDAYCEAYGCWPRITHPAAWLRRVALRCFLRQRADAATHRSLDELDAEDEAAVGCTMREVVLKEEEQQVLAVLAALPPRQRMVMAWHLDGFDHCEIGREMRMSAQAVRQNISRARSALKQQLGLTEGGTP